MHRDIIHLITWTGEIGTLNCYDHYYSEANENSFFVNRNDIPPIDGNDINILWYWRQERLTRPGLVGIHRAVKRKHK